MSDVGRVLAGQVPNVTTGGFQNWLDTGMQSLHELCSGQRAPRRLESPWLGKVHRQRLQDLWSLATTNDPQGGEQQPSAEGKEADSR